MENKEILGLYNAYVQIHTEQLDENRAAARNPEEYEHNKAKKTDRRTAAMNDPHTGINSPAFRRFMAQQTGRKLKEDYDVYDLILSYLLYEGYAETPEAAESIMVNMSEEWRESIVEEFEQLDEIMRHQQERDRIEGMKKKSSRARTWSYEPPTKGKHGEIERRQAQRPPSRLRSGKLPKEREEG